MTAKLNVFIVALCCLAGTIPAYASLTTSYEFSGKGNWSLDGIGGNGTPVGDITALVPTGSTVEKAFLYTDLIGWDGALDSFVINPLSAPIISLDGTSVNGSDWIALGAYTNGFGYVGGVFRADVTSQVAGKIGSGSAAPYTFTIDSKQYTDTLNRSVFVDGQMLAIIYSNPNELNRRIAIMDGLADQAGDTSTLTLANPLTSAELMNPAFEATLSLGIGYSFQGAEATIVDVNGARLTTCAGGNDDGFGLAEFGTGMTIGGVGDSTANPANPFCTPNGDPAIDDELYDLSSYLAAGDTQITLDTINPSEDDLLFFAGVNMGISAVPLPSAFWLFGSGLMGVIIISRRKNKKR